MVVILLWYSRQCCICQLSLHRYIWNQDEERIGVGRYCERSYYVSKCIPLASYFYQNAFLFAESDSICYMNRFIFNIKMPSDARVQLINDLADIEYASLYPFEEWLILELQDVA